MVIICDKDGYCPTFNSWEVKSVIKKLRKYGINAKPEKLSLSEKILGFKPIRINVPQKQLKKTLRKLSKVV